MSYMSCPYCRDPGFDGEHCGLCDCRAQVNSETGNTIYVVRGRIVAAPDDLRQQLARRDAKYGIRGSDPVDFSGGEPKDAD